MSPRLPPRLLPRADLAVTSPPGARPRRLGAAFTVVAATACLSLGPGTAHAQSAAGAAAAEALYDEGTRLYEAGDYAGACPKLAESFRLDPALGALLALAACREKAGQLASAWVTYLEVVSRAKTAGDADREQVARERADALAPRLPRLRIELGPAVAALPGLTVTRDGQGVDPGVAATPVPVDPGEHVVVVAATGRAPVERRVTTVEGKSDVIVVDQLAPQVGEAPPPAVTPPPDEQPADDGLSGLQVTGLVTGGLGLAALGVGLGFGAVALGAQADLDDHAYEPDGGRCSIRPEECPALHDEASTASTISTILVIGGGALAATGLVLVVVGGNDDPPDAARVVVAPTLGGLTMRGSL